MITEVIGDWTGQPIARGVTQSRGRLRSSCSRRSVLPINIPKEVNFAIFHRDCRAVHNQDRNRSFEIHSEGFLAQASGANVIRRPFRLILEEPRRQRDGSSTRMQP